MTKGYHQPIESFRSFFGLWVVDLAPAAAEEDEEGKPASKVAVSHSVHLVSHGPLNALASSWGERSEAAETVLAEDHSSSDDEDGELEDTDAECAPDGAETAG